MCLQVRPGEYIQNEGLRRAVATGAGERPHDGAAAQAGFSRVEILFVYALDQQRIADLLERHRLELVLFDLRPGDWEQGERGLLSLRGREREFLDTVREALDMARRFGTRRLNAIAGVLPPSIDRADAERTAVANLKAAAPLAQEAGVLLLIENINTTDMPGYLADTVDRAAHLVELADHPCVRLQLDQYHVGMVGGDARQALARYGPLVEHVQIADVPDHDLIELARRDDEQKWTSIVYRALAFLGDAAGEGGMRNFMSYDRRWLDDVGTEDSVGRAIWSLGVGVRHAPRTAWREICNEMLERAVPVVRDLSYLRALAYAALGLSEAYKIPGSPRSAFATALRDIGSRLAAAHAASRGDGWEWFEPVMTYDNARLPEALLRIGGALLFRF